jgi:hypothetical protein
MDVCWICWCYFCKFAHVSIWVTTALVDSIYTRLLLQAILFAKSCRHMLANPARMGFLERKMTGFQRMIMLRSIVVEL